MSNYHDISDKIANVGSLDASGANTVTYASGRPFDARRVILVTTTAHTTADATITVAVRDVDNGNSTTIGTFVLPFTGSAADDVQYVDLLTTDTDGSTGVDGSTVYTAGGSVEVNPGQEIAFTSDGGGDAGTYQVYLEYYELPFSGSRKAKDGATADELTFTPA